MTVSADRLAASWAAWAHGEGEAIAAAGQWRTLRSFDAAGPAGLLDGAPVVSFASNDYLGLTQHPAVRARATDAIERWGTGAGASRLVVGSRPIHHELESGLASWKEAPAALLFPTGFAANLGVLTTFGHPSAHILSDELNHASIIDGCRLAKAPVTTFAHNDVLALAALLDDDRRRGRASIVVTDAVFSMDGDVAHLGLIGELCRDRDALLVVDEAHAVFGEADLLTGIDGLTALRVGTLSKTLGSLGGFVTGPAAFIDLLVNRARPFIFTTAPTPADTAAALAALEVVRGPGGTDLRGRLRHAIDLLVPGHPSPIIPVIVGEETAALAAAEALLARGLFVPAIRPPTVAPGTSRLRIALSALHTDEQLVTLRDTLSGLGLAPAPPRP